MNHLVLPHLTFYGLANDLIISSPNTPVTAVVFLDSGATGFVTTDAWRIPWTEQAGGLQSTGLLRVGHY